MENDKLTLKELFRFDLKKKIKFYFSVCCISFTILELVLSTLNACFDLMSSNLWINNIEMFAVCLCIALLMFITDRFSKNHSLITKITIDLLDILAAVYGLGGIAFKWFTTWDSIIISFCVILVVYFLVFLIMILNAKITDNKINKKILERKGANEDVRKDN